MVSTPFRWKITSSMGSHEWVSGVQSMSLLPSVVCDDSSTNLLWLSSAAAFLLLACKPRLTTHCTHCTTQRTARTALHSACTALCTNWQTLPAGPQNGLMEYIVMVLAHIWAERTFRLGVHLAGRVQGCTFGRPLWHAPPHMARHVGCTSVPGSLHHHAVSVRCAIPSHRRRKSLLVGCWTACGSFGEWASAPSC